MHIASRVHGRCRLRTRPTLSLALRTLALAAALTGVPAAALVAPSGQGFDRGTHDQDEGEWVPIKGQGGGFVDVIDFSLGSVADRGLNPRGLGFLPTSDIRGGLLRLLDGSGSGSQLWSGALGAAGSVEALAAGADRYELSGTVSGSRGGSDALRSSVSDVPELETYAMMLAGLGVIGFLILRRARRDD